MSTTMSRYAGNITFTNILVQPSQWGANYTSLTAICIALSIAIFSAAFLPSSDGIFHKLDGFHLVTAWTFFSKRYDFFQERLTKTGVKTLHFRALQYRIFALAGEANRQIFFNDRNLNPTEGYRILLGGLPKLEDINVESSQSGTEFIKRLLLLFRKERINEVLPLLLEDVNLRMKDWGTEGKMNPFKEVYDLVFQMTVRLATCRELSDDREVNGRIAKLFWDIENSGTPASILLPSWFPISAKKTKRKATLDLYTMLLSYVNIRRKASTPSIDPIDLFISIGLSDDDIVGTMMSIIFAGVINTGVNSSWALLHLGTNPKWKRKATDEYKALIDKYTNTTSSDPLHVRLSTIPLDAWEDELPSLDAIIRETLRISGSLTAFRRNIGEDIQVEGGTIKKGDFVAYLTSDVNLNPDIYTNPMTFDPDRYGPGREEDRKIPFGYLAWGVGRHPCTGMRIAKLEIKVVLAMVLLGYEYELVDSNGNRRKTVPDQDRNDLHESRPLGDPCYMKYKRVVE